MSKIYPAPEVELITDNITFKSKPIQGSCEFCYTHTYNGYNFLNKTVCEECREKLLRRLQIILTLE